MKFISFLLNYFSPPPFLQSFYFFKSNVYDIWTCWFSGSVGRVRTEKERKDKVKLENQIYLEIQLSLLLFSQNQQKIFVSVHEKRNKKKLASNTQPQRAISEICSTTIQSDINIPFFLISCYHYVSIFHCHHYCACWSKCSQSIHHLSFDVFKVTWPNYFTKILNSRSCPR